MCQERASPARAAASWDLAAAGSVAAFSYREGDELVVKVELAVD
jgi:hypothetical protein